MAEDTISLRVDRQIHERMKLHDEINWSAVLRKSIAQTLEQLEKIDATRAQKAVQVIDKLRKARAFSKGKPTTEIIREWRSKRRL